MVDDSARASKALRRLDEALAKVSSERSRMSAVTNRLGHSLKIAQHTAENLVSSESKIRDADIAKEMMGKVKTDILLQANQLVLAKAGENAQDVLALLR